MDDEGYIREKTEHAKISIVKVMATPVRIF